MAIYTDFSAILAIATVLSGLIWGIDALIFRPRRVQMAMRLNQGQVLAKPKEPKLVEYAHSFFPILLIVCILRSFIVEPFRIPSGSMKPTLLEGDFILVNKYTYGIRLPVFGTKIIKLGEPKRGDILVFRYPKDTSVDFIKRVVGIPGDKISYQGKVLRINGNDLSQEFLGTTYDIDPFGQIPVKHYKEMLHEQPHSIYVHPSQGTTMEEITVPQGMYFVMGDNRDNSEDSRIWGFVPQELILGKAFFIWMSWDSLAKDIRWQRLGEKI